MASLQLFGVTVQVDVVTGYRGAIGGLANELAITVAGNGALKCTLHGRLPLGALEPTGWEMDCTLLDGVYHPQEARLTLRGNLTVDDIGFPQLSTRITDIALARRAGHGVVLRTEARMLDPFLDDMTGGTVLTVDQQSYGNAEFWWRPDFGAGAFSFEPHAGKARMAVTHYYEADGSAFNSVQAIPIVEVVVDPVDVTVKATAPQLYVHGDLVDKRPASAANHLLYQHALVNGELHCRAPIAEPERMAMSWAGLHGTGQAPVLLALRWRDENGHPLAFRPVGGSFTLRERIGFDAAVPDGSDPDQIERSNRTVGVVAGAEQTWTMHVLDAVEHYRLNDELHQQYGPVMVTEHGPRELHGLAGGVVLRYAGAQLPIACTFSCADIADSDGKVLGWKPQIALQGHGADWTFQAFLAERDSSDDGVLSVRSAAAREDAAGPVLPLVDAMSVAVNLLPRARSGEDPAYAGLIAGALQEWLTGHDAQFAGAAPTWLAKAAMPSSRPQAHQTGFALLPGAETLGQLAAQLRATARLQELVPPSAQLQAAVSPLWESAGRLQGYVHGVPLDSEFRANVQEIETRLQQAPGWNAAWVTLMNQWVAPDPEIVAAVNEVRSLLNVVSALPSALPVNEEGEQSDGAVVAAWQALRYRLSDMALAGDLDDIERIDGDDLAATLESITVDEFAQLLAAAATEGEESPFLPLVRWLDAPVGPELLRRIIHMLLALIETPTLLRFARLTQLCAQSEITPRNLAERLLGAGFLDLAKTYLTDLKGILTDLGLAENMLLAQVREAWRANVDGVFDALKARFGPLLTNDLLDTIAADAAAAAALLEALGKAGLEVYALADLIRRPPEYLFATRRFASLGEDWDKALRLWSGSFGLASLAEGVNWRFFLGDASSIIVKLGEERSLQAILREAHQRFASKERPDPLGLGAFDVRQGDPDAGMALLLKKLGPALLAPSWSGLLILRPTADIAQDLKLRDLCGFEYVDVLYVAVAGRPLAGGRGLDISAAIEALALGEMLEDMPPDPDQAWQGDVNFGLTRFSVSIRRSLLDAADIAFQLRIKNLMGTREEDRKGSGEAFQRMTIRGTLPPADPARPDDPRDIQFALVLEPPVGFRIDKLCFDRIDFAGLRVKLRDGKTYLDIDADLHLQKMSEEQYPAFFDSVERLKLNGFRINLPSLEPGAARGIGKALGLDFEWPSVEFSAPRARGLQLFGLEVTPTALGILRTAGAQWDQFRASFLDIDNWELPSVPDNGTQVPYIRFRLGFGALPALGVSGKLSFDLVVGLLVVNGQVRKPFIVVDGVAGKKITIDLFRLITITIDELIFKRNWSLSLPGHPPMKASGLLADRATLKILGWNPLGEGGQLSLANLHRTSTDSAYQEHGFVVGYEGKKDQPSGGGKKDFVEIHWVVLGQNIALPKGAYDYLLASGSDQLQPPDEVRSMLTNLLVYQDAEDHNAQLPGDERKPPELVGGVLNASFTKNPSWLFGISFKLGGLLELGNLVLHDQHYYGIRLRDRRWVAAVFGQDTIEFAYIPGARPELDRFRTNLRIPLLDMLGPMTSGEVALEWAVNWDFLIDIGYPWKTGAGHNWFRAFSLPLGTYEGKFGFFLEKSTSYVTDSGDGSEEQVLMLGCGAALYVGLFAGYGNKVAFVRAGIGIFGMFEGRFWMKNVTLSNPATLLKATIVRMEISGTIGIFAYAEGRIEVWILSASFRAWAEASFTSTVIYVPGATCAIAYSATLAAGYSASVKVGSGWFSWTFRVAGTVQMPVSGRVLLA